VYQPGDVETATDRLATVVDDAPEDTTATARVQRALEHLDNRPTDSRADEGRSDRLRRRRSQRAQSDAEQEPSAPGGDAAGGEANESATSSEPSK
jgi:hypothetical protein